jgi:hypothetical protein
MKSTLARVALLTSFGDAAIASARALLNSTHPAHHNHILPMPTDNSAPSLRSTAEALSLSASILGSVVIYSEARCTFTHHSQGFLEMRGRRIGNALQ